MDDWNILQLALHPIFPDSLYSFKALPVFVVILPISSLEYLILNSS